MSNLAIVHQRHGVFTAIGDFLRAYTNNRNVSSRWILFRCKSQANPISPHPSNREHPNRVFDCRVVLLGCASLFKWIGFPTPLSLSETLPQILHFTVLVRELFPVIAPKKYHAFRFQQSHQDINPAPWRTILVVWEESAAQWEYQSSLFWLRLCVSDVSTRSYNLSLTDCVVPDLPISARQHVECHVPVSKSTSSAPQYATERFRHINWHD